jgi:hypothetical protein
MAAQWYCLIRLKQYGPFTSEQVRQLVQQGQLQREHGVRTETDSEWTAAGDLPGLFPPPQAVPVQPVAPAMSIPPYPKPEAPAPDVVPSATPLIPPGVAVPAAPVASVAATRAQGSRGRAQARPVSAARPIPLNPVAPPVPPVGTTRAIGPEESPSRRSHASRRSRPSRKNSPWLVGGLGAGLLLLIVGLVVVMNRGPGKKAGVGSSRPAASSKGTSGDSEIKTGAVAAAGHEPADIADPPQASESAGKASVPKEKAAKLPAVTRWLEATRQKGGIRDVVRLGVANAWLDSADGKPAILNVEIEITNLSPDDPLDFSGWRPEVQPQADLRAVMADDAQTLLAAAPSRVAANRRAASRRIAPNQSETEQLRFLVSNRDSKQFRLILPWAALGQTGNLGFELPSQMIKDRPPGVEEPAAKRPGKVASQTSEPSEPEPIGDLRTEIEQSEGGKVELMDKPAEPAAEEAAPKETEGTPDLRKQIEEEDPQMESTNEEQPSDKEPAEEPRSP